MKHANILSSENKFMKLLEKYRWELFSFCLLTAQLLVTTKFFKLSLTNLLFVFYLIDFSVGIVSRALVGTVVNLFFDTPTKEQMNVLIYIVMFLLIILVSFAIGRVAKKARNEDKNFLLAIITVFCFGSMTFHVSFFVLGLPDHIFVLIGALSLVFLTNKYLKWFVPILSVIGIFVHYAYASSILPLVILVLFYLAVCGKNRKTDTVLFAVTLLISLATFVYCVFFANKTLNISDLNELSEFLTKKSGGVEFTYIDLKNYDYYFFGNMKNQNYTAYMGVSPLEFVLKMPSVINEYLRPGYHEYIACSCLGLPMLLGFVYVWIKCIKTAESKAHKFVYSCFILVNATILINFVFSTDAMRWVSAGLITQFGFLFTLIYCGDKNLQAAIDRIKEIFANRAWLVFFLIAVYASCYVYYIE